MTDAAAPAPPKPKRGVLLLRLGIAHLLAYPIAFVWAVAWIPPMIAALPTSFLLNASTDDAVRVILHRLAWPSGAVFVLEHLVAIPWGLRDDARGKRAFWWSTAALFAIALVGGGAFWIWLVLQ